MMAYPDATLLQLTSGGLVPVVVEAAEHYRAMREFWRDPQRFVAKVLAD